MDFIGSRIWSHLGGKGGEIVHEIILENGKGYIDTEDEVGNERDLKM